MPSIPAVSVLSAKKLSIPRVWMCESCPACPTQCLYVMAERDVYSCQPTGVLKGLIQTLYLSLFDQVYPDLWQNFWGSTALCLFLDFGLEPSI